MGYAFGHIDEMGKGPGFRKVRQALGVTAFGVNAVVYAPGQDGFLHYHDEQDELYFVHSGTAFVEVEGETRELGPGGLVHVESTTPRKISNRGNEDLVMLVVGGKDGYVGRDGRLVHAEDLERRIAFGTSRRLDGGDTGVGSTEPGRSEGAGFAGAGAEAGAEVPASPAPEREEA